MNTARRRRKTKSPMKIFDEENIDPVCNSTAKKTKFTHSLPLDVSSKNSDIVEIDEIVNESLFNKQKKINDVVRRNSKNSLGVDETVDDSKIDTASSSGTKQDLLNWSEFSKLSLTEIDTVKLLAASVDVRGGFCVDNYHSDRIIRFRYTAQTKKIPKFPRFFDVNLDSGRCFVCFLNFLDHEGTRGCWEESCQMKCHENCLPKMKFGSYTSFHATLDEPEFQGKVHCPMHHCNKCYADHLHTRAYQAPNTLIKCRLCLSYFHPSCIPAGCEISEEKTIVCPRHIKMEIYRHRPTVYCAQCNERDDPKNLIMCSNCPRSFHQRCNKSLSYTQGSPYGERCDFCVDNCFALVGDKVYAQYGGYGYYPAIIVPNERIYRLKRKVPVGSLVVEWVVNGTHTLAVVSHYQIIPSCFGSFFFKFPSLKKIQEHGEFHEDVVKNNMRLQKQLDNCHKRSRNRTVRIVTKMVLADDVKPTKKEKIHEKCNCPPSNDKERCNTESCENRRMGVECPPSCKCSNRLSAHVYSKLKVLPTDDRGFGLFAKIKISAQAYIGEYCGELITEEEHNRRRVYDHQWASRDKGFYMFQLGKLYIDAALIGSVLRYANHSCDPNCIMKVLRDCSGLDHICMYAIRDIEPNEELTFDYSGSFAGNEVLAAYECYCGAENCTGTFAV